MNDEFARDLDKAIMASMTAASVPAPEMTPRLTLEVIRKAQADMEAARAQMGATDKGVFFLHSDREAEVRALFKVGPHDPLPLRIHFVDVIGPQQVLRAPAPGEWIGNKPFDTLRLPR